MTPSRAGNFLLMAEQGKRRENRMISTMDDTIHGQRWIRGVSYAWMVEMSGKIQWTVEI